MKELNLLLKSELNPNDKMELMYPLFAGLEEKVNQVLLFGPSNTPLAEKVASIYYDMSQNKFFPLKYNEEELAVLPAILALELNIDSNKDASSRDFERFLKESFIYGTGSCEYFAIVGAYFLAREFDVRLSIETIFSDKSHTYIRLHTDPEYVIDFWSSLVCSYDDNMTWSETLGENYMRTTDATYKTEISLNSAQLIEMGSRVFTEENKRFRAAIIKKVNDKIVKIQEPTSIVTETFMEQFTP